MKGYVFKVIKRIAVGLAIFFILILGAFSWLNWFASYDIKVAVGSKFPLLTMIDNHPVNEEAYLGNTENDPSIYEKEAGRSIYPVITFTQSLAPVKKLCLIDFTGDTVYKSFELQQLQQENTVHYVMIMYRQDNGVDIYYTKGLNVNEDSYKALMNQVTLIEAEFTKVHFDVGEKGIDAYVSIKDKQDRRVEFNMKENKDQVDRYGIVAPIGERSANPEYFPIIYLKNFNMVQQNGTEIFVKIDGKSLEPQKLIPLFNYKRVYLSRYSDSNHTQLLNQDYSGRMKPIEVPMGANEIKSENNLYSIMVNNGHPEIKSVKAMDGNSEMRITFSPALPDLVSLKDNTEIEGRFSIGVDEMKGIMGGVYSIRKNNGSISLQMNPQKGWQPMPGALWMKTYLWNCDIKIAENELLVTSKWKRTE